MKNWTHIPHLVDTPTTKRLLVNGQPFLMLAGESQNSSFTSAEYMDTKWQELADANFNTILGCVTWEMIEPEEGEFNFDELDRVIVGARQHNLHLVLLWFGSFKNGMSTYAPGWVKCDQDRFPRANLRKPRGVIQTADVLSLFNPNAMEADAKAFGRLMSHIKEVDEAHSTVLMVQVENEPGLLGDSRDGSAIANAEFNKPVPDNLLKFLQADWDALRPDLKDNLRGLGHKGFEHHSGKDWEAAFGNSSQTDEIFMAYHYALFINHVAAAGKAVYPLPFYTNVWMNYVGEDGVGDVPTVAAGGDLPGDYPSGGSTSNVLDIWQIFAPNLDFISPDVYFNDYSSTCLKYRHRNQPLFIPEQRRDGNGARRTWVAFGSYSALGTSPFGIDTLKADEVDFKNTYGLLNSVKELILEAQARPGSTVGFFFDEIPDSGIDPSKPVVRRFGEYELTIRRCFVFGKPGPGEGMVIHQTDGTFLLIGWGFQVEARALSSKASMTGILRFEEKTTQGCPPGSLRTLRTLNGDETRGGLAALMPSPDPDYGGFPICVTIPARTMVAQLKLYYLE